MKNSGDSTKLEGTNNYKRNKTSKNLQKIAKLEGRVGGDNKYPETKGTKITRETKLPKISKKTPSWRGELEGTINTPLEGTNNYAQTKTSKKCQYYYMQNKTFKISKKKLPSWRGQ
jgi:hypothetical protein